MTGVCVKKTHASQPRALIVVSENIQVESHVSEVQQGDPVESGEVICPVSVWHLVLHRNVAVLVLGHVKQNLKRCYKATSLFNMSSSRNYQHSFNGVFMTMSLSKVVLSGGSTEEDFVLPKC